MSVEAIAWVLNHAPVESPVSKLVLVALANHAHPDGSAAFPSVNTICRYTCLSERSVRQHLDNLERRGVIRRCDPKIVAAYIKRADRRPIGYDILINEVHEMQVVKQRGAGGAPNGVQEMQERGAGDAPKPSNKPSIETHTASHQKAVEVFHGILSQNTPHGVAVQMPTAEWGKSMCRIMAQGATLEQIEHIVRSAMSDDWYRKNIRTPMRLERHWERLAVEFNVTPVPSYRQVDGVLEAGKDSVVVFHRLRKSDDEISEYILQRPAQHHGQLMEFWKEVKASVAI